MIRKIRYLISDNDFYVNQLRLEETAILGGTEQYGARFGTAISTVGDLNADSFPGMT